MDLRLKNAAETGDITTLYALIKQNVQILEVFDEQPFVETPLHVSAAKGHIRFAMQMVTLKPSFARKLNQSLCSPLHIAVKKGHTQLAIWLLKSEKDLLRVKGIDCKTPLHFAIEEENLDLLAEFLTSYPESIRDLTVDGYNALHLAIKMGKLEATKMLVQWFNWHRDALKYREDFFNGKDVNGNTPLHIAAKMNTFEIVKRLSKFHIVDKNIKNSEAKTPLDILEDENKISPQLGSIETQKVLRSAGGLLAASVTNKKQLSKRLRSEMSFHRELWMAILQGRKEITDEKSSAMLVVAALIITIAFQGVLSPPGGVFQASADISKTTMVSPICNVTCSNNTTPTACTVRCDNENKSNTTVTNPKQSPGMSTMPEEKFKWYWVFNTFSLMAAFAVTVYLLPPGPMAIMFLVMLFVLLYGYQASISIISPSPGLDFISYGVIYAIYVLLCVYFVVGYGKQWHIIETFKGWANSIARIISGST